MKLAIALSVFALGCTGQTLFVFNPVGPYFSATRTGSPAIGSVVTGGTPNFNLIVDGSGNVGQEQFLGAARFPALIGDVTTTAGSLVTAIKASVSLTTPIIGVSTGTSFNGITGRAVNTITLGTTAAAGSASTVVRTDDVIAAFNATVPSITTPLAASVTGSAAFAARVDHTHRSPGGCSSIVAASSAIANTETQVVVCTIPANLMQAGTTFHIHAGGNGTTSTTPGNSTFRIRMGTSSLSGNIPVSVAAAANASVTGQPFTMDAVVTVRTAGSGGTVIGDIIVEDGGSLITGLFTVAGNIGAPTSTVALDTTATKLIELTFQSGASTSSITFQTAFIEIVQM